MTGRPVSDVTERALIRWIREAADAAAREFGVDADSSVELGIGDDCAVVTPSPARRLVLEVDDAIEGVHFRLDWMEPPDVGHRLATQALSDLAAMGAVPRWGLLALGLPGHLPVEAMRGMVRGCARQLARFGARLVGGNLSSTTGPLRGTLTLVGEVEPGRALARGGSRPGDAVFVTGELGLARAGWTLLERGLEPADAAPLARYRRPEPRVVAGRLLSASDGVSAAIDLSDGLREGARDLVEASGVGLELDETLLPVGAALAAAARRLDADPRDLAATGGDDFELLVTGDEAKLRVVGESAAWPPGLAWTRIGRVVAGSGVAWIGGSGFEGSGAPSYAHFG